MTHKERALAEMAACCARAAGCWCWSSRRSPRRWRKAYDWYSFNVLPRLGQWVAGDGDSYRYLAESIRMHPDQAGAEGDDEGGRFRPCRRAQPDRRRGGAARRGQVLKVTRWGWATPMRRRDCTRIVDWRDLARRAVRQALSRGTSLISTWLDAASSNEWRVECVTSKHHGQLRRRRGGPRDGGQGQQGRDHRPRRSTTCCSSSAALTPEQAEAASKQILERLIDQELAVQKADGTEARPRSARDAATGGGQARDRVPRLPREGRRGGQQAHARRDREVLRGQRRRCSRTVASTACRRSPSRPSPSRLRR